jgi:hypothetical protein
MANKIASLVYVCLIGIFTLGSASSFAISCPDPDAYPLNGCELDETVDGSFPYFDQAVRVNYKQSKHSDEFRVKAKFLKGSLHSYSVAPDDILTITKTVSNSMRRSLTARRAARSRSPAESMNSTSRARS